MKHFDKRLKEQLQAAKSEIYIAEGSDWFWWYGEPNNSGQDHIFDYLFREHLKNVYRILDLQVPKFLESSLLINSSAKYDTNSATPAMDGQNKIDDEWLNAGFLDILSSNDDDTHLFEKVLFEFVPFPKVLYKYTIIRI